MRRTQRLLRRERGPSALCFRGVFVHPFCFVIHLCNVQPRAEPSQYLQLAQLEEGQESLSLLDQGIALLEERLREQRENRKRTKNLKGKNKKTLKTLLECLRATQESLASAYAARAELFMTDLCDSTEAEENAEKSVSRALELSPTHPEALLSCAQLRKVKGSS